MLLGVVASIGPSKRTRRLVETALAGAQEEGFEIDLLDLHEQPLDFAANKPVGEYSAATQDALERTARAEGFVFASPIYRATYTGAFKNYFDLLPAESVIGKVAALVATGGTTHHFLAPDILFRPILTFFNMHTVPGVLYATPGEYGPDYALGPDLEARADRLGRDLAYMVRQLAGQGWGPPGPGIATTLPPSTGGTR